MGSDVRAKHCDDVALHCIKREGPGFLDDLETEATALANTAERDVFWSNVLRMVEFTEGVTNLSAGDQTALDTAPL